MHVFVSIGLWLVALWCIGQLILVIGRAWLETDLEHSNRDECIADSHPQGLWGCDCRECVQLQEDAP